MRPTAPRLRVRPSCRQAAAIIRPTLEAGELILFDILCRAGDIAERLPYDANVKFVAGARDPRRRLRRLLRARPVDDDTAAGLQRASTRLARRLHRVLTGPDADSFRSLRVLLGNAPATLAPDCRVPDDRVLGAAWRTVTVLFSLMYSAKVGALGRLRWLDASTLRALRRELLPSMRKGRRASGARAGLHGRWLALDPRLMRRVGRTLGRRVTPAYSGRYVVYTKPGDYFWPHTDDPEFSALIFICLERTLPKGAATGSASLAYFPDGRTERFELAPGEALAMESRGLVHAREPLQKGERIALLAIGVH